MSVPSMPFSLMSKAYRKIFPSVHKELSYWKTRAEESPIQNCVNKHWLVLSIKRFIVRVVPLWH